MFQLPVDTNATNYPINVASLKKSCIAYAGCIRSSKLLPPPPIRAARGDTNDTKLSSSSRLDPDYETHIEFSAERTQVKTVQNVLKKVVKARTIWLVDVSAELPEIFDEKTLKVPIWWAQLKTYTYLK